MQNFLSFSWKSSSTASKRHLGKMGTQRTHNERWYIIIIITTTTTMTTKTITMNATIKWPNYSRLFILLRNASHKKRDHVTQRILKFTHLWPVSVYTRWYECFACASIACVCACVCVCIYICTGFHYSFKRNFWITIPYRQQANVCLAFACLAPGCLASAWLASACQASACLASACLTSTCLASASLRRASDCCVHELAEKAT